MTRWSSFVGATLWIPFLWTGCGGATRDDVGSAAGGGGGSGDGGASGAGTGAAGSSGAAGSGGTLGAGGSAPVTGGAVGSGGRPREVDGGMSAGGVPSYSCRAPYIPPPKEARKDGPEDPLTPCSALPDAVVLGRYSDDAAKVPKGFYYDLPGQVVAWLDGCASSSTDATAVAEKQSAGSVDGASETPWFYETALCNGDTRTLFRQYRCDYFDGTILKDHSANPSAGLFWAGLEWYSSYQNLGGATLISGSFAIGNAADRAELCTTETTYGDFGLCDEVRLYATTFAIAFDGTVTRQDPGLVRTLKGTCR